MGGQEQQGLLRAWMQGLMKKFTSKTPLRYVHNPDLYINSSDVIRGLHSNCVHQSIACENALWFSKNPSELPKHRSSRPFITKSPWEKKKKNILGQTRKSAILSSLHNIFKVGLYYFLNSSSKSLIAPTCVVVF